MYKRFFLLFFLFLNNLVAANETISVVSYNLLYYGHYNSYCTSENNNVDIKANNLHTIINYLKPDIFAVNELGRNVSTADHLLNNALNINEIDFYKRAAYTNIANSDIVNMLYYNKNKFGLVSQSVANTMLRDVNLYKLYYKADDLSETQDTTYLTCVVAHLKAGSSGSDQEVRTNMVNNVMAYLDYYNHRGNILFMGDFNINSSYETSYQVMTNYQNNAEIRFNDPINKPGQWYNNSDMAMHHTQSTHSGSSSCFAGGGMDDRYDFILANDYLLSGDLGFKYVENSYEAIGQDGLRFNQTLIYPDNNSQPEYVINAMYNFSDHLPVALELEVTDKVVSVNDENNFYKKNVRFNNPVTYELEIIHNFMAQNSVEIMIIDVFGKAVKIKEISASPMTMDVSDFMPGMYFLVFTDSEKQRSVYKFIKL